MKSSKFTFVSGSDEYSYIAYSQEEAIRALYRDIMDESTPSYLYDSKDLLELIHERTGLEFSIQ